MGRRPAARRYRLDRDPGPGPDCTGTQYLVTWNGHGDALALWQIGTGGALTLVNSYSYSTWGSPTVYNAAGSPLTWTDAGNLRFRFLYVGASGVAWDDVGLGLGLLYMSARHYSPALGRFLQPDPSAAEANLYEYVGDNPVTQVDPSGQCWWCALLQKAADLPQKAAASSTRWFRFAPSTAAACQRFCVARYNMAHILEKHGQNVTFAALRLRPTLERCTKFLSDSRIIPLIRFTLANPTQIRWLHVNQAANVIEYAYKSLFPVGIDGYGRLMFWVRVVVVGGQVQTAYPAAVPFR